MATSDRLFVLGNCIVLRSGPLIVFAMDGSDVF